MRRDNLFIEDILDGMNKIFKYTEEMEKEEFKTNELVIDAVLRNIEIIGEAANKVSDEMRSDYQDVPWSKMIGLRNIVIDFIGRKPDGLALWLNADIFYAIEYC
ncbi:MAG: HepT-like ribonuclease domain-containing protein [Bacillota bacterium]